MMVDMQSRMLAARGIIVASLTSDEWFALAVDAERIKKLVGPLDPSFEYWVRKEADYLRAAEIRSTAATAAAT